MKLKAIRAIAGVVVAMGAFHAAQAGIRVDIGTGSSTPYCPVHVGSAYTSGASITLSAATLEAAAAGAPEWVIWIYDEDSQTTTPTHDIGPVSITGTPSTMPSEVRILIAPAPLVSPNCSGGEQEFGGWHNLKLGATTRRVFSLLPLLLVLPAAQRCVTLK
jgi:hypothetical protein